MSHDAHEPEHLKEEPIKVVILDTNAYFMQYAFVILDGEKLVARGRAGTQRGLGKKIVKAIESLGYVVP